MTPRQQERARTRRASDLFARIASARDQRDAGLLSDTAYQTRILAIEYDAADTKDRELFDAITRELANDLPVRVQP